jgi:hypothetical protein
LAPPRSLSQDENSLRVGYITGNSLSDRQQVLGRVKLSYNRPIFTIVVYLIRPSEVSDSRVGRRI